MSGTALPPGLRALVASVDMPMSHAYTGLPSHLPVALHAMPTMPVSRGSRPGMGSVAFRSRLARTCGSGLQRSCDPNVALQNYRTCELGNAGTHFAWQEESPKLEPKPVKQEEMEEGGFGWRAHLLQRFRLRLPRGEAMLFSKTYNTGQRKQCRSCLILSSATVYLQLTANWLLPDVSLPFLTATRVD